MKVLNIITGGIMGDGITASWLNFCAAFRSDGDISIEFAAPKPLSEEEYILRFEQLAFRTHLLPDRIKSPLRYLGRLVRLIRQNRYDIVHVNGSSAIMSLELLAAWIGGVKIRIAHSRNTQSSFHRLDRLLRPLFRRLTTLRIACGEEAGKWLFGRQPFQILHNGKFLHRFRFDDGQRTALRLAESLEDKIVIGHVGKFNEQKNHPFLIRVFREILSVLPSAHLYLTGTGPMLQNIKELVEQNGLENNVTFAGETDKIEERLLMMDYMILPSLYEGLPNVVVEWQASGLFSTVSSTVTRESAATDLVHFESLESTPAAWAETIVGRLKTGGDRKTLSDEAIEKLTAAGFDAESMVHNLKDLYTDAYRKAYQSNRTV